MIGIHTNITERELASILYKNSNQAMFVTDSDLNIMNVNAAFTNITGYTEEDVIGKNPRLLASGQHTIEFYEEMWKSITENGEWRGEIWNKRKNGVIFPEILTIKRIKSDDHQSEFYCALFSDNSEQYFNYKAVENAKRKAEEANLVKSTFLATMSHELRTPLNAILGLSETIMLHTFGPVGSEKYEEYLKDIFVSGHYLLDLINDILDISAIEAQKRTLEIESFDINTEIIESTNIWDVLAAKSNISIEVVADKTLPKINADLRSVKQIIYNIVSNAIKFSKPNGNIFIRTKNEKGVLKLSVEDQGIGIAEKSLKKIFEPFYREQTAVKTAYPGTGLGLSIVKTLVEAHDGEINITSTLGKGTLVEVTLPILNENYDILKS